MSNLGIQVGYDGLPLAGLGQVVGQHLEGLQQRGRGHVDLLQNHAILSKKS